MLTRTVQIVPVVAQCGHCHRYHHPVVRLDDDGTGVVTKLPDNCWCGESLDTPGMIRDCIGTARNLVEASRLWR